MPPKARITSKRCEECGSSCPVACRLCPSCGSQFHPHHSHHHHHHHNQATADSPEAADAFDGGSGGERRRSERVKREKPDYYDALEFENKKRKKSDRGGPNFVGVGAGGGGDRKDYHRPSKHGSTPKSPGSIAAGRVRKSSKVKAGGAKANNGSGRAKLSWKKGARGAGHHDDDGGGKKRRKRKQPELREVQEDLEDEEDDEAHMMDDLPLDVSLHCQVGLAEINRRLGMVMTQPA